MSQSIIAGILVAFMVFIVALCLVGIVKIICVLKKIFLEIYNKSTSIISKVESNVKAGKVKFTGSLDEIVTNKNSITIGSIKAMMNSNPEDVKYTSATSVYDAHEYKAPIMPSSIDNIKQAEDIQNISTSTPPSK